MTRVRVIDRASGEILHESSVVALAEGSPADGHASLVTLDPATSRRGRIAVAVVTDGWRFEFELEDADLADLRDRATSRRAESGHDGPTEVRAIIPGRVVSLAVDVGTAVEPGQRLLAVEAMKMENELRAPRAGVVERLAVGVGQTVELGDVLVVLR